MKKNDTLISFPVIVAATNGDVDAINAILKYYEGYIATLSTKKLYDKDGNSFMVVDEDMRRRLETKLITKIIGFKVA